VPWQSASNRRRRSWPPLTRVSKAQSAVVNDSPADCQSRRPGRPQAAGKNQRFLTGGENYSPSGGYGIRHYALSLRGPIGPHPRVASLAPTGQFTFWQSPDPLCHCEAQRAVAIRVLYRSVIVRRLLPLWQSVPNHKIFVQIHLFSPEKHCNQKTAVVQ